MTLFQTEVSQVSERELSSLAWRCEGKSKSNGTFQK